MYKRQRLKRPSKHLFETSLIEMGFNKEEAQTMAKKSGYTQTILRRLIKKPSASNIYEWMEDERFLKILIPIFLLGRFDSSNEADKKIACELFGTKSFSKVEEELNSLLSVSEDCPIWKSNNVYGNRSKLDALFLTRKYLTKDKIDTFFSVANEVLAEKDPALELEKPYRTLSFMLGKTRKYSHLLRKSICETLCLLSAEADSLISANFEIEEKVDRIIYDLLHPISEESWSSHYKDLDWYAEASPKSFIKILLDDLKTANPTVFSLLLVDKDNFLFGGNNRIKLLNGLEKLAWDENYMLDVVKILCKLSEIELDDNYTDKPIHLSLIHI